MLNPCDAAFLDALAARLPADTLRPPEPRYLEEPRGRWQGRAGAVARPARVEEVAEVIRACAAARVGVVPFGGGTSLVGGQVMTEGPLPLVLSLERMAAVRSVSAADGALVAEAGATLRAVQEAAEAAVMTATTTRTNQSRKTTVHSSGSSPTHVWGPASGGGPTAHRADAP